MILIIEINYVKIGKEFTMSKKLTFGDGSEIDISIEIIEYGEMARLAYQKLLDFIADELVEDASIDKEDLDDEDLDDLDDDWLEDDDLDDDDFEDDDDDDDIWDEDEDTVDTWS